MQESIYDHILTPFESLIGVTAICGVVLLGLFVFGCASKPQADCDTDIECTQAHPEVTGDLQ